MNTRKRHGHATDDPAPDALRGFCLHVCQLCGTPCTHENLCEKLTVTLHTSDPRVGESCIEIDVESFRILLRLQGVEVSVPNINLSRTAGLKPTRPERTPAGDGEAAALRDSSPVAKQRVPDQQG